MTMRMRIQTTPFGSFTDVDLVTLRAARFTYRASYGQPASLSWVMYQPQHTFPLGIRSFVQFWDDAANGPNGSPQSSSNPLFEGFIEEVQPTDSNLVSLVAYDPTYESTRNVTIMNLAYQPGTVPTIPPSEQSGSMPRLIFNATIDNDDDFAFCEGFNYNVGGLIQTILDWTYQPLYWFNAAPGDGSDLGNDVPYVLGDLTVTGFGYQPQEKEVFESESPRSAVDRLLRYAPQFRLIWTPGSRKWRFFDITASPTTTLTINESAGNPQVLSFEVNRSLEGRYTAVRFFGPEVSVYTEAKLSDSSLTDISPYHMLQSLGGGLEIDGMNVFQITDPALRNVARLLPTEYYIQNGPYAFSTTRSCSLQAYFPSSADFGQAGWVTINGWILDGHNGIISVGAGNWIYRYTPTPSTPGGPQYQNPTDVKFIYGSLSSPLQFRYPATGFQGTAYTVANIQNELKLYDEMLAIGYEYNNPVTSTARLAQFAKLAEYELTMRQDIVYTGGATLDGCRYEFAGLNKRINFAGKDMSGGTITTGWESINAMLTDVEIDFDQQLTTLTLSSDQMELAGLDVEEAKKRLKIRALEQRYYSFASFQTIIRERRMGENYNGFDQFAPVWETQINVQSGFYYVDQVSGAVDSSI